MTILAVTSVNSLLCQASTCFRIGSKFLCIRSTPTGMPSMNENDFECLPGTGVNTPETNVSKFGSPSRCSNPDIKLGMTSYLGFPITWPNGDIFGTICVLDSKSHDYNYLYRELLLHHPDVL